MSSGPALAACFRTSKYCRIGLLSRAVWGAFGGLPLNLENMLPAGEEVQPADSRRPSRNVVATLANFKTEIFLILLLLLLFCPLLLLLPLLFLLLMLLLSLSQLPPPPPLPPIPQLLLLKRTENKLDAFLFCRLVSWSVPRPETAGPETASPASAASVSALADALILILF